MSLNQVGILIAFASAALNRGFRWNAVVAARWILAEVDLNPIYFNRDSGRLFCERIYAGNDNAL